MTSTSNMRTASIGIPGNLLERFNRLAKATRRMRSYHINKALESYIVEQEYLITLFTEGTAEAESDLSAVSNADAIASAIATGLMRPEAMRGSDPVSDEEYEAAQQRSLRWR